MGLAAAVVFSKMLFPLVLRLTQWTPTDLDTRMVRATRRPITLGIVLLGVYLSLVLALSLDAGQRDQVDKIIGLIGIVLGVMAVVAVVSNTMDWYLENLAGKTQHVIDPKLFPLLRRTSVVFIYGLGGLLVMDLLNINISPLIAGLGLGGLAVALAIQPTLANLFAGTYVMTEGVISTGDYIELESGLKGYVVEVGWRSTRIRDWRNNLVVVPNAKFAETIITNYQQPSSSVNVWFECGTSYDSDLYRVEEVCREVMDEVLETEPMAVKEYGSWFGFDKFGDSNVVFWLFVQAKDRWGSFVVQSELMKLLHKRFREEGIVINYPMRTLQFPKGWDPETFMSRNGRESNGQETTRQDPMSAGNHRRRGRRRRLRPARTLHIPSEQGRDSGPEADTPAVG